MKVYKHIYAIYWSMLCMHPDLLLPAQIHVLFFSFLDFNTKQHHPSFFDVHSVFICYLPNHFTLKSNTTTTSYKYPIQSIYDTFLTSKHGIGRHIPWVIKNTNTVVAGYESSIIYSIEKWLNCIHLEDNDTVFRRRRWWSSCCYTSECYNVVEVLCRFFLFLCCFTIILLWL